ncbi:MAG: autotransporter outer membrane beta-barrel domain-containing protein, partial [Dokdonella sp.]
GASLELQRGVDSVREIVIDVNLTCSSMRGSALVPFDAQEGSAVAGSDYIATAGVAVLDLTAALNSPGPGAPVAAVVRIEVLDNATASTTTRAFSIVRREGSFQGMSANGSPIVGAIPGSGEPLVEVTIAPGVTIDDGAGQVPGLDPAAAQVSVATTAFCAAGGAGAGTVGCASTLRAARLIAASDTPANQRDAAIIVLENNLLAIAPDETTSLAFIAPRMASGQVDNVGQRLAALRAEGSNEGLSTGGLVMLNNGMPLSLGMLPMLLRVDDEESADNEERRTLLGGTRLGIWINGTLGAGERDRRGANSGFDSDTWDVTSGVDYRFSDRLFAGAALGFSRFDGDYSNDQGSLEGAARAAHVYGGYSLPSGLGFDAALYTMRTDYTQRRVVELLALDAAGTGVVSLGRDVALGDTEVKQSGGSVGATWTFMRDAWTFAPQAQLSFLRTRYAAFSESGPSAFNLHYLKRAGRSRSFSAGAYIDHTWATSAGAFRPYGRAFHFFDSGPSRGLLAEFALDNDDGARTPLALTMNELDRRYATGELGLGFSRPIGTRTVDFNMGYLQMFGFSDWDRWALRFDVRIPL